MKSLLITLCLLTALMAGGCPLILMQGQNFGLIVLVPLAILVLNGLILASLWGFRAPDRFAFYTLAAVDFLIVAATLVTWFIFSSAEGSGAFAPVALGIIALFGLKGWLTMVYARRS
jgi:hypothetical protein